MLVENIIINTLLAIVAYKLKALTLKGVLIAYILGVLIFYLSVEAYAVLFLYYVVIVAVEKITLKKKNEKRSPIQVLANIFYALLSLILYIVFKRNELFVIYCIELSVSISDTMASTIGTKYAKHVYSITKFKETNKGVSGAISICGTISGIISSIFISVIYFSISILTNKRYDLFGTLLIIVLGVIGMLTDSILGDLFQKKYRCEICNKITDNKICCGTYCQRVGISALTNTQVNIVSEGIIFIISIIILII